MADDDTAPEDSGAPAHGPAIAGKGKGKKGLLNGPHREEIIVVCSVIGVGLAFLTLRKGAGSAAGTAPAAATLATSGTSASLGTGSGQLAGGYSDGNAGLQQYLAQISDQLGGMEANLTASQAAGAGVQPATPSPLASTMFAPDPNNRNWVLMPNGVNAQVESDGSLFGATATQFFGAGGTLDQRSPLSTNLDYFSTQRNVQTAQAPRPAGS